MYILSLQELVKKLASEGNLHVITKPVSPFLEMTEIADRIYHHQENSWPILFQNTGTVFPVFMNIFARKELVNSYLSLQNVLPYLHNLPSLMKFKFNKTTFSILKRLLKTKPHVVKRAPCQAKLDRHLTFDDLPILTCWPKDAGRFITLPLVHTIDPETGEQNMGMYRMQIFDSRTAGLHWHVNKGGAIHFEKWKKLKKRMPVTITLGGPPALIYAATAPLPHGISEYMLTGFLLNKRLTLVKSITNSILIPAESEIVLEGYVDPEEPLRLEGPFGDHTGFYSVPDYYPVFHLELITYRKNAIYPATVVGIPPKEDELLGKATTKLFTPLIKHMILPELHDLYLPTEGGFHNLSIVSINNSYQGAAEKAVHAIWSLGMLSLTKIVIIVENSTNIQIPESILNAIDEHVSLPTDLIFSKGPLDVLDHAASSFAYGGKVAIDATFTYKQKRSFNYEQTKFPFSHEWASKRIAIIYHENIEEVQHWLFENQEAVQNKIIVAMDKPWQHMPKHLQLWFALSAVDPLRDILLHSSAPFVFVNASSKNKKASPHHSPWPDMVVMKKDIVQKIDESWHDLGFSFFEPSPSQIFLENFFNE